MQRYNSGNLLPFTGSLAPKYKSLSDVNGNVPIVKLSNLSAEFSRHNALMKLESCNPTGSIKDKNASYLIDLAESKGQLRPGGTIIESSSGNFGIALAAIGASRGYKVIIVIDAKTPITTKRMLAMHMQDNDATSSKDDSKERH